MSDYIDPAGTPVDIGAVIDAEPIPDQVGQSALSDEVVAKLREPLDERRVQKRQNLSYIAAHDAIRTANAIFGFGNWGHEIVELVEIAAVEVEQARPDNAKPDWTPRHGWSVGYRCTVRLTVRGCIPLSGVGYGDGIEYTGPPARHRAAELAVKEAESDALKRALVKYGDQWGLILYAKADERKRIDADRDRAESAPVRHRQETAGKPELAPRNWTEIGEWLARYEGIDWAPWIIEAGSRFLDLDLASVGIVAGVSTVGEMIGMLTRDQKDRLGQKMATFATRLHDVRDPAAFPPPSVEEIRAAFAFALDGLVVDGPADEEPAGDLAPDVEFPDEGDGLERTVAPGAEMTDADVDAVTRGAAPEDASAALPASEGSGEAPGRGRRSRGGGAAT